MELIEAAKLLCYKALWLRDRGRKATEEAAMAESLCPAIGIEACNNAMLTFGHIGYSSDYPIEQRLRGDYGYQVADGTADIQRLYSFVNLSVRNTLITGKSPRLKPSS